MKEVFQDKLLLRLELEIGHANSVIQTAVGADIMQVGVCNAEMETSF